MIDTTRVELITRLADTYTYQEAREVLVEFLFREFDKASNNDLEDEVRIAESALSGKITHHPYAAEVEEKR